MNKRQRSSDAEWQQLIEQQQRSGLSASVFCQQNNYRVRPTTSTAEHYARQQ